MHLTKKFTTWFPFYCATALLVSCGAKDDTPTAPSPKAPVVVQVSAGSIGEKSAPAEAGNIAPVAPPPNTATATPPPTTTPAGPEDEFKGMTPKQIEDFKKNATPETHDTNIGLVAQAVLAYNGEFGHAPATLEQLVSTGFLHHVPIAPKGKKYVIDAKTLSVKSVDK